MKHSVGVGSDLHSGLPSVRQIGKPYANPTTGQINSVTNANRLARNYSRSQVETGYGAVNQSQRESVSIDRKILGVSKQGVNCSQNGPLNQI